MKNGFTFLFPFRLRFPPWQMGGSGSREEGPNALMGPGGGGDGGGGGDESKKRSGRMKVGKVVILRVFVCVCLLVSGVRTRMTVRVRFYAVVVACTL